MQKSLKKSLYLGLAALSFASVAGATNANAAKKHHSKKTVKTVKKAKPVTYTSSYNLDQSVVYSLNGNNAIYTKPGTVKGARVVASKSDVKSVANSSKGYFMAYGEAKTSKGAHYYKVVSFNHKYRGWVYAGSAKKVDSTTTATDTPKNNVVYLKSQVSNTLWDAPKYSAFKTTKAANNNSGIANDQYTVDKAVKLNREGWTYYHVTNKTNANYNGWVWAGATNTAAPTENFNAAKDIKVNFTYNGSTVKSSVFHAYDFNLRMNNGNGFNSSDLNSALFSKDQLAKYNNDQKASYGWLASQLAGTGYVLNDAAQSDGVTKATTLQSYAKFLTNSNNANKLNNVKAGDTVWLDVNKDSSVTSKFNPVVLNGNITSYNAQALSDTAYYKPMLSQQDANLFTNAQPTDSQYSKLSKLFNDKDATSDKIGQNNTLAYLMGKDNSTYLDAASTKTVYKSDKAAADAYQRALSADIQSNVPSQYNGMTLVTSKDSSRSVILDKSTAKVVATADHTSTNTNLVNVKPAESNKTSLSDYRYLKGSTTSVINLPGTNYSTSDLLNQFAGLSNDSNNPYGVFDLNGSANNFASNGDKSVGGTYTKQAVGGNTIHFVYFLAPQRTQNEMSLAKMGNPVTAYYYAVPVAGPANSHQANGTDKY